jgi:hypothetical protein
MDYSFKDFATQFANFTTFPISAAAVASSQGFNNRPISLRLVMSAGAPYVPDVSTYKFLDNSKNPSQVSFFWVDDANLPQWVSSNPLNPLRSATSWQLELWETLQNGQVGAQVFDVSVPGSSRQASGLVQYDYNEGLIGNYLCQVTAFNNYGSASTPRNSVQIELPSGSPSLSVKRSGTTNSFVVTGSGFPPGATVTIEVDGGATFATPLSPAPPEIHAGSDGSISNAPAINCQPLCTMVDHGPGGGSPLRFEAIVNGTPVTITTSSCIAT